MKNKDPLLLSEPPRWRWRKHRLWRELDAARRGREWMQASWEWSQRHPGMPTIEVEITREGTTVHWNGPPFPDRV